MLIRFPGRGRNRRYFRVSGMTSSKPVAGRMTGRHSVTQTMEAKRLYRDLPDIQIGMIVGIRAESIIILDLQRMVAVSMTFPAGCEASTLTFPI
jgi:hypothetical protein